MREHAGWVCLAFALAGGCAGGEEEVTSAEERIINGTVGQLGLVGPNVVSLHSKLGGPGGAAPQGTPFCSGTLIHASPPIVLTAAHCVWPRGAFHCGSTDPEFPPSDDCRLAGEILVYAGAEDAPATEQLDAEVMEVAEVRIHPLWNRALRGDVALLRLADNACVSPDRQVPRVSFGAFEWTRQDAEIHGFGNVAPFDPGPAVRRWGWMELRSRGCPPRLPFPFPPEECAGGFVFEPGGAVHFLDQDEHLWMKENTFNDQQSCNGDSGGPIVQHNIVLGVSTGGDESCSRGWSIGQRTGGPVTGPFIGRTIAEWSAPLALTVEGSDVPAEGSDLVELLPNERRLLRVQAFAGEGGSAAAAFRSPVLTVEGSTDSGATFVPLGELCAAGLSNVCEEPYAAISTSGDVLTGWVKLRTAEEDDPPLLLRVRLDHENAAGCARRIHSEIIEPSVDSRAPEHERWWLRGDADDSGMLDLSDAVQMLNMLFAGAAPLACDDLADANDDGRVDLSDPVATLHYLFLGGAPLDATVADMGGGVGPDATPSDSLSCF